MTASVCLDSLSSEYRSVATYQVLHDRKKLRVSGDRKRKLNTSRDRKSKCHTCLSW